MRSHLGTSFTVWNRQRTWFWLVRDQGHEGGTIGTAATEADAIRDACSSIEEMSAQLPSRSASPGPAVGNALLPMSNRVYPCNAAALSWMDLWIGIAHRATDRMFTRWGGLVLRSS
jgi:hypothetical protein